MAITDYAGLKSAIATWIARDDLTAYVADFIVFAEGYINSRLRVRQMEEVVSLSPTLGVFTLPTDYLQYRKLVMDNGTRYPLAYITPDAADMKYPTRPDGIPQHFTIIGSSLYTFPTTDADIELTYWQGIPALSDSNTTNWLLTLRPEAYLRLGCAFASEFIKSDNEAQKQLALADGIFAQMEADSHLANYSRAGHTSQGVTP